jgi:predicted hydrocarbon binding protein
MNKKVIELLAGTLKLTVEELTQAIETEGEVDFKLPEGVRVLSGEELETIKDNHGKTRYDAGKTAGSEMLLKDLSEKVGFSEAVKDGETFVKNFKNNILDEAKVEPNKKVTELESSLGALRNKLIQKDSEFESLQSSVKVEKTRLEAQSYIPELPESLGLKKSEAANLLLNGVEFKEDGIYKNGSLLKDNMEKPISMEDYISSSVSERGWGKAPTGRGGGSGASGGVSGSSWKPKTMEEFESVIKEKGLHPGSADAQAILADAAKEHPEILG